MVEQHEQSKAVLYRVDMGLVRCNFKRNSSLITAKTRRRFGSPRGKKSVNRNYIIAVKRQHSKMLSKQTNYTRPNTLS